MKELPLPEQTSPPIDNSIQLSNTQTHQHNLIACTRIHLPSIHSQNNLQQTSRSEPNLSSFQCKCKESKWSNHQNALLTSFILTSLQYCDQVAIAVEECVHCETQFHSLPSSIRRTIDKLSSSFPPTNSSPQTINDRVILIPIKQWGKFTPALNTLLNFAANLGYDRILYQSLEVRVNDIRMIPVLLNELNLSDTLVVGASFSDQGHLFAASDKKIEKKVELNGVTSPWNTFAIWNTAMLLRTGFLPISEGLIKGVHAGVEEVSVIALQQFISSPSNCQAKLIEMDYNINNETHFDGSSEIIAQSSPRSNSLQTLNSNEPIIEWITEGFEDDDLRKSWHSSKMSSKLIRAASQVTSLQLPPGEVTHKKLFLQSN